MTIPPLVCSPGQKIRFLQEEVLPYILQHYADGFPEKEKIEQILGNLIQIIINKESDENEKDEFYGSKS